MDNSDRYSLRQLVKSDHYLEELCEFLARGGDPNHNVLGGDTLLHAAAQSYKLNEKVVQKLINAGADIDLSTNEGTTPLQFAVMYGNCGAVEALIKAGAQINVQNSFGQTALHYAVQTCHSQRRPSHFHIMHTDRCTPNVWIMKMLLDHGNTDINPVDSEGETPLMWAVKHECLNAVKTLLKGGANPSIPNQKGQNSLHVALSAPIPNHYIVTELLLNGVGIYHIDNSGQTPIDILLKNVLDDSSFHFVQDCLGLIAFKYHIREDLESKLKRFPECLEFLRKACKEVQWMNNRFIYDNITLHDFASDCFQERRGGDPTLEIYIPVVEILLSGMSEVYKSDILKRMSRRDLCNILEIIDPPAYYIPCIMNSPMPPYETHLKTFQLIQECYREIRRDNLEHSVAF